MQLGYGIYWSSHTVFSVMPMDLLQATMIFLGTAPHHLKFQNPTDISYMCISYSCKRSFERAPSNDLHSRTGIYCRMFVVAGSPSRWSDIPSMLRHSGTIISPFSCTFPTVRSPVLEISMRRRIGARRNVRTAVLTLPWNQ